MKKLSPFFVSLTLLATLGACGQSIAGFGAKVSGDKKDSSADVAKRTGLKNTTSNPQKPTPTPKEIQVINREVPAQSATLVKSSRQLGAALSACVGAGKTEVKAPMLLIAGPGVQSAEAFLVLSADSVGKNFLLVQEKEFDGESSQTATSVRSATMSLAYLSALRALGNVVASNCVPSSTTTAPGAAAGATASTAVLETLCDCRNAAQAKEMLGRCLPHLSDELRAKVEAPFAETCQQNARKAIASLIASAQFARFD